MSLYDWKFSSIMVWKDFDIYYTMLRIKYIRNLYKIIKIYKKSGEIN